MLAYALAQARNSSPRGYIDLSLDGENLGQRALGLTCAVPSGRALFWQGDQQGQTIKILRGVVRVVRLLENGNRQIIAFYWPGDIVPAHALSRLFTAETVTSCHIVRNDIINGACTRDILRDADQILEHVLSLLMTMSQKNSISRIASLLLSISRHLPNNPRRQNCLQLLLPRADMADYVGTSLETVCRTLGELKARKLIDLPTRKTIRFLDFDGLSRIAEA
jgi:CRP-like cAMP-binding protein